ncbi:MAG: hypothetical protein IT460_04575 [Planctomycetes bacterium]|nr:hypothetical protein [Planctomycetota bacterium]
MVRRALLLVVPVLAAAAATVARAGDVVVLTSGVRLEGRVVSEDTATVVFERAGGRSRVAIPRATVASIERGRPEGPDAGAPLPDRDEWWLLKSDHATVGTRHLLSQRGDGGKGWRLEEHLLFLPTPRMPAVRVDRVEETTDDFLPRALRYVERGESGGDFAGKPYETSASGEVADGVWRVRVTEGTSSAAREVALPKAARGPLSLREALVRASPRPVGLVEMPLVDTTRGEVRTVRAGFTAIDAGAGGPRVDVLRVEDAGRVLESRWTVGDPPRCLVEDVAPGVVAVPCTREQADAVAGPRTAAPDPVDVARAGAVPVPDAAPAPRVVTLPDVGVELRMPSAAWTTEVYPPQGEDVGRRVVAKGALRRAVTDLRVEWDPAGGGGSAALAAKALLDRMRPWAPDVRTVGEVEPSTAPGVLWRGAIEATVRGERVRTWVLVADRGAARVTVLVTAPAVAVPEVEAEARAILDSFRLL